MNPDAKRLVGGTSSHGRSSHRRLVAALLGAIAALALVVAPATAAVPVFQTSFDGSTITPTPANSFAPGAIAVDEATGDVWVIDMANDVVRRFSSAGVYEATIDGVDTNQRAFDFGGVDGIAVDNSGGSTQGNVYIAREPDLLYGYRSDGGFLWETRSGFSNVCGVDVASDGSIWTSDYIVGLQERNPATGVELGPPVNDDEEYCQLAIDSNENALWAKWEGAVFKYLAPTYTSPGTGVESNPVVGLDVDRSTDNLYTARLGGSIGMFNSAGTPDAGSPFGSGNYRDVAVNSDTGLLYATLPGSNRVEIYRTSAPVVSRSLRVVKAGTGSGTVRSDPAAIDCGATCEASFDENSEVTLTATPSNSTVQWTGCDSATGNECRVTLDADTEVTATFAQDGPGVAGESAGSVTDRSAVLRGTVDPNGSATTCTFEYGLTAAYGTRVPCSTNPGSGVNPVNVTIPALTGLLPSTTYHYRINATNAGGTTNGGDRTFTTLAAPAPTVVTGAASSVTQTGASLAGTVNPNGYAATCYFEYGTTTAYGTRVACASDPGSGTSAAAVTAALSGLAAGTTYHYRLVATGTGGTTNGNDATFATAAEQRTCATDASLCPPPERRTCATDPSLCPAPTLSLDSASAAVSGGKAAVKLSCEGTTGTCSGKVQLVARVRGRRGRSRSTVVGSANVSIAAGRTATVRISLSRSARSALARTGRLGVTISGAGLDDSRLTLRQPVRRGRRSRGRRGRRGRR